ncbi:ATP-binding cassette sub-family G member 1-like [Vespa mandarinia]|uniref:ATP-binding cassette sub-family G member 1-like n=1 Tax=Vespa mandarinia TaxID=7446 RepID=UPI0016128F65|nr:ATP-binding cassette sub-family G member 1-like [Vespa mandarinia]XP_035720105.1 ATP-binding cassette sub-family G member 1-like [Vespa mandarinia]XP_035720106.1 ATP-binding cassette sub-family G member 1-like [Vespa mandarinia]XP_035720107.1 ATP-binding cassette sub-family G member 1-like [Vespa mandarinia]XP_035720108.1 ATP-binding cassette sub-family G member 1-like [Vespa mandarinia]
MYNRSTLLNLSKSKSIDIQFVDVVYEVQDGFYGLKKQILKGINGLFKSGNMTAIMGPSGAGKSTLLNILTGFKRDKSLKGNINYLNNKGNKESWNEYKKHSCYILQEDQLPNFFTVNEMMMISANLKLGNILNEKAKQILIDDILDTLDLIQTKNTRTNKLSGGQKKRLSIALELIDNPPVMFLDEPTTGLDSSSSLQCVTMLQKLARSGKTIICTIHQPSAAIYKMFDHVYLLADGRCMYEGAAKNTINYFADLGLYCPKYHNPADYMLEIVNKEYGNFNDQLVAAIESNKAAWRSKTSTNQSIIDNNGVKNYNENKKTAVLINTPSEFTRFWILLNRCFIQFYRDWTLSYLKMLIHFSVGLFFGLVFENSGNDSNKTISNISYIMISLIYLCYTSMMPAVLKFPLEMAILKKERFNNWYQLRTYYIALLIANVPLQILLSFIYCSISYFLSSQPLDWNRFLMFFGICTLTIHIADSFGLVIGTMLNPVNGTFISVIIFSTFIIFAGFFIFFNHMPQYLYYFSYLNYMRYALEGSIQSLYGFNRENLNCPDFTYCHFRIPQTILVELGMTNNKYWFDVIILIINFIFYRIIAYYTLKRNLLAI